MSTDKQRYVLISQDHQIQSEYDPSIVLWVLDPSLFSQQKTEIITKTNYI